MAQPGYIPVQTSLPPDAFVDLNADPQMQASQNPLAVQPGYVAMQPQYTGQPALVAQGGPLPPQLTGQPPSSQSGFYHRNPDAGKSMRSMHSVGASRMLSGSKMTSVNGSRAAMGASRSLRASKASIATTKSLKSTIQQEYHDLKVQGKVRSMTWGKGKVPFRWSLVFFFLCVLFFLGGLTTVLLRFHQMIVLTVDRSEIIGPLFFALSALSLAVALKFIYDSHRLSNLERERLRVRLLPPPSLLCYLLLLLYLFVLTVYSLQMQFHASSSSHVAMHTVNARADIKVSYACFQLH